MPIQDHGYSDQTAAELQQAKLQAGLARAERAKVRAVEGVIAMREYLADVRHVRQNTVKLRNERLAREAAALDLVEAVVEAPVKARRERKSRKLDS